MARSTSRKLTAVAFGASLAVHGAAWAALEARALAPRRAAPRIVELTLTALPPPPPEPLPEPEPEPEPERPALRPRPATERASAPEPEPPAAEPPPAAENPEPPTGVTSTGTDTPEWAAPAGTGPSRPGPLVVGPARTSVKPSRPAPAPRAAPAVVASHDLSERPRAPRLDAALEAAFPAEARRRGVSGTGVVRARIDADGRVRHASVLSETFRGFGDACRRTVVGSRWSAPRDRAGHAVATEVRYTCRFVVDR